MARGEIMAAIIVSISASARGGMAAGVAAAWRGSKVKMK
jgi:hypothetical protein